MRGIDNQDIHTRLGEHFGALFGAFANADRGTDAQAAASRARILEYNEDDCRATKALRDWLNGPAKALAHRDDFGSP